MAKRRKLQGRPLLVASAGAALAVGCGGGQVPIRTGNLMPPPEPDHGVICVTVTPEEAVETVTVHGQVSSGPEHCVPVVAEGSVVVEVSAPGYTTYTTMVDLAEEVQLSVELEPEGPPPPPTDVAPPPDEPPPPVGNLMPPPELPPK